MNVVIVNCFDTYEERADIIKNYFKSMGNKTTVIQSDFRHIKKARRSDAKEDYYFIKTKSYIKNISIKRIYSHYRFAKDALKLVETIKPDLLYVFIPPNYLAKLAANYKKKNTHLKLIFDIMDLWPENMPISLLKKYPPFSFWGKIRDWNLKYSDYVITECNLYQHILKNELDGLNVKTLYLVKQDIVLHRNPQLSDKEIHLAYLGSINNVIDTIKIKGIIQIFKTYKPVTLHIIGTGESRQQLIDDSEAGGAKILDHGEIYDSQEKQAIFDKCHFGLNIMKNNISVGLTMKSIDYFQHGLPIINNIPEDSAELVSVYNVGLNVFDDFSSIEKLMINNLNFEYMIELRRNTLELFSKMFTLKSFISQFDRFLNS